MEKRALIAFLISLLIIIFYPYWLKKLGYEKPYHKNDTVSEVKTFKSEFKKPLKEKNDTVYDTVIENNFLRLVFNSRKGYLKRVVLKEKINKKIKEIELYSLKNNDLGLFSSVTNGENLGIQTVSRNRIILHNNKIIKDFTIRDYVLKVKLKGINEVLLPFKFTLRGVEKRYFRFALKSKKEEVKFFSLYKTKRLQPQINNGEWLGINLRYYDLIFDPQYDFNGNISYDKAQNLIMVRIIPLKEKDEYEIDCFLGPNSKKLIQSYNSSWKEILHYGKLSAFIFKLLEGLYSLTGNYGLSIIIIAIFINMLFFPLSYSSLKNMKKMQLIQPQILEIRQKYKDDPQAMNREIMMLYRKHKLNPMSGCLPMFLQIPIFFALYNTLMRSYELKGAKFLWIKDLASPDQFIHLPFSLPILGSYLNLLPILMGVFFWLQMRSSPTGKTTTTNFFFPVFFVIIFYRFPSGLVLYWLTNTMIMVLIQRRLKK